MTALYGGLAGLYTWLSTSFAAFGLLDAIAASFIASLILTWSTLACFNQYRRMRPMPLPLRDRSAFVDETVSLAELVEGQEPFVMGKKFVRCIIRGPGQIKMQHQTILLLPTLQDSQIVPTPLASNISGATLFVNADFDRCFFENIAFVGTSQEMEKLKLERSVPMSVEEWKAKRWQ